jgi:nascent polypeptide-associated complex subunit alpha
MGGRMDPRKMNQMMKQLGIDVKEIENVQEVVIRTPTKDYVFDKAEVTIMTAQGQKTYQVVGKPRVQEHDVKLAFSDEDVKMVMEQAGVSEADAKKALTATGGDLAEAIMQLQGEEE